MRMHIHLDDELVAEMDRLAGPRERTAFVRRALIRALDEARREKALRSAAGALADAESHAWDDDPAAWVRAGRRVDDRRNG